MNQISLIDKMSLWVAGAALLLSFILFLNDTGEFFSSLAAAAMTAGLVWCAYILTRWIILAFKK